MTERDAALLLSLDAELTEALEPRALLSKLAHCIVPQVADLCVVDEIDPPFGLRPAALMHADPDLAVALRELPRRPALDPHAAFGIGRVRRTGRAELHATVPDAEWLAGALGVERDPTEILRALGQVSCIFAPIGAFGQMRAVMTLVKGNATGRYGTSDLRLVEEIAHRAALAMQNAIRHQGVIREKHANDEVLAIVAHDLRNPLGAVYASAGMLERISAREARPDRERKALHTIMRAAQRMERLTADLLDFARMQSGRLAVERKVLDAAGLISEAYDAHESQAQEKGIHLSQEADPDMRVRCDRDRVLQVLSNLLGNAIKFTPAGGHVVVRARQRDGEALFSVSDTGVGIPHDAIPFVFDRLWHGDNGSSGGLGLGLFITKGLVEAHGGRIWLESEVDRGTTFYFTLPLEADAAHA
jgi:signal transduction histidine kinase